MFTAFSIDLDFKMPKMKFTTQKFIESHNTLENTHKKINGISNKSINAMFISLVVQKRVKIRAQ